MDSVNFCDGSHILHFPLELEVKTARPSNVCCVLQQAKGRDPIGALEGKTGIEKNWKAQFFLPRMTKFSVCRAYRSYFRTSTQIDPILSSQASIVYIYLSILGLLIVEKMQDVRPSVTFPSHPPAAGWVIRWRRLLKSTI